MASLEQEPTTSSAPAWVSLVAVKSLSKSSCQHLSRMHRGVRVPAASGASFGRWLFVMNGNQTWYAEQQRSYLFDEKGSTNSAVLARGWYSTGWPCCSRVMPAAPTITHVPFRAEFDANPIRVCHKFEVGVHSHQRNSYVHRHAQF